MSLMYTTLWILLLFSIFIGSNRGKKRKADSAANSPNITKFFKVWNEVSTE
jgi:hypothetical protein